MAQKRGKPAERAKRKDSLDRSERPLKVRGQDPVKTRSGLGETRSARGLPKHLTPGNPGNSGGKKGRSGRHTKAFKRFMQNLAMSPAARRSLKRIMAKGDKHPFFPFAMKLAAEYAHGKPQQHVDVTSKGKSLEDIVGASHTSHSED